MKLSIIIPAYNCEAYISKSLRTLLNQTYADFEIIVVDDGSKDNSRQIAIDTLNGRNDSLVLNQENRGVSAARNLGIRYAEGDYISFIDSDDYVLPDYIESLLKAANNVDFLQSGTLYMKGTNLIRKNVPPVDEWNIDMLKQGKANYLDYTTSIHGKLYKKSIIDRFDIHFNENMSFAEDRDFNIEYINHIEKARNISYSGYCYQMGVDGCLSSKFYDYKFENDIVYWNKVFKTLGSSCPEYHAHQLFYYIVDNFALLRMKKGTLKALEELQRIRRIINKDYLINNLKYVHAPIWQKLVIRLL